MSRNRHSGVTLIELMIVIVVLAILTSIAVPSYRSYMIRTQRTEAKTALLNVRAAQEKFYLQNNRYTDLLSADTDASPPGLGLPGTSDNGLYTISVDLGNTADEDSDQAYTVTATPLDTASQKDDTKCTTLTLNDVGVRGATGPGGVEQCWR
jgi:type IV pilus assembly protein PilE